MLNFMKSHFSGKKIILLFIVFCSMSFGQDWNPAVQTSINEPNVEKMDLTANASGVHVLIKRTNGNIVYYYLNSSGIVTTGKTYTMEADGDFPNIVASNDNVYALYKTGSNIKGKYSTNGGTSWINLPDRNIGSNLCNGVDAVYELGNGVHLVWATRDDNPNFKTYYSRLRPSDHQWVELQNVTSHTNAPWGGNPSVVVSPNRVHVSFNTNNFNNIHLGEVKTRDRFNGIWLTPQPVVSSPEQSSDEKLSVRNGTLYLFYSKYIAVSPPSFDLLYKTRNSAGVWSGGTVLTTSIMDGGNAFILSKTYNDNIHLICNPFDPGASWELGHSYFNGSIWSSPILLSSNIKSGVNRGFSSVSNDVFATWGENSDGYLRYSHYDAAPLAPQNLTAQPTQDYHPKLIWNNNQEPDIQKYYVYRSTNLGYYNQIATVNHNSATSTQSYIDYTISVPRPGGQAGAVYYYVVSAVDLGQHISGYSNYVAVTSDNFYLDKSNFENKNMVTEYGLDQNYPNPFNPSTVINYQIKDKGFVSLKVYDMLGKGIAELVNETQESGEYSVNFNASNLPSGVYIYSLRVNDFIQNHKMLMTK